MGHRYINEGARNPDGTLDKNDPLNYIGGKFMEEDGYLNNVYTQIHHQPRRFPFGDAKKLTGSSYHKTTWVPVDKRREDIKARRRLERDPNHPQWLPSHGLLRWWHVRITLLGSDDKGRQIIMIRKGEAEPIYLRFGRTIEISRYGKTLEFKED